MRSDHHQKFRLKYPAAITLLISLPLIFSITLSVTLLSSLLLRDLENQANGFGQTSADLLAVSCQEYLLTNDLLSLNVLLSELVGEGYFNHASIYSADNRLLAESGTPDWSGDQVYTAEIHYQDSIAGHLRLTLSQTERSKASARTLTTIVFCNLLLIAIVVLLAFRWGDRIWFLLEGLYNGEGNSEIELPDPATETDHQSQVSDTDYRFSILVIRFKPARVARILKPSIVQAISLYNGEIIHQKDDEVTVYFGAKDDHCFQAICTLLVIRCLADGHAPGLALGAGIHCGSNPEKQDLIKKQAIYLASLGYGNLLTSATVFHDQQIRDRVKVTEYHSSLSPDTKVFAIESLQDDYQRLIDRQAAQLNR
jgi:uncharacterized membrane protein affecting hemolysin expression